MPGFKKGDSLNTNRTHPLHSSPIRTKLLKNICSKLTKQIKLKKIKIKKNTGFQLINLRKCPKCPQYPK
jgi:hypothetical protein